jgi:hypothetical protein
MPVLAEAGVVQSTTLAAYSLEQHEAPCAQYLLRCVQLLAGIRLPIVERISASAAIDIFNKAGGMGWASLQRLAQPLELGCGLRLGIVQVAAVAHELDRIGPDPGANVAGVAGALGMAGIVERVVDDG